MVGRNSFVRGLEWQGNGGGVPMGETLYPSVPETAPGATCCNSTPFHSQRWPRLEAKSYDHPIQRSCSMATETPLGAEGFLQSFGGPGWNVQAQGWKGAAWILRRG